MAETMYVSFRDCEFQLTLSYSSQTDSDTGVVGYRVVVEEIDEKGNNTALTEVREGYNTLQDAAMDAVALLIDYTSDKWES